MWQSRIGVLVPLCLNLSFECSFLNRLTSTMCASFSVRMMAVPKNDKYKDYARYAAHCLNVVASTRDPELRCIQREMAAEWLRLADAIRHPRRSEQMQMG
jgi:hypothetical protein